MITHILCLTLDISNFSVQLRSFKALGTSPIHNPFARLLIGSLSFWRSATHVRQISLQLEISTGPDILYIGSLICCHSFHVTDYLGIRISWLNYTSFKFCNWDLYTNKPHTAYADSICDLESTELEKSLIISAICSKHGGLGRNLGFNFAVVVFIWFLSCHAFWHCLFELIWFTAQRINRHKDN